VRGLNALIAGFAIQLKQIADGEMVPVGGAPAEADAEAEEAPTAETEAREEEEALADDEAPAADDEAPAADETDATDTPSEGDEQ